MSASQSLSAGPASFQQRALTVTITLGQGTFGQSGKNTVTLSGLRVEATVRKGGMPSMDTAEIRVYGVQPTIMNAVSQLGVPWTMVRHNNTVTVQAGDPTNGTTLAFSGYLIACWQDFSQMPETMLRIVAHGGAGVALFPGTPSSYPGGTDVATIMAALAAKMGLTFENNGVHVQLASPYFAGTYYQQAQTCAQAANIFMYIDTGTEPATLAIWPKAGVRRGAIPLISAETGLIGYPSFYDSGIEFQTLFNPQIVLGGQIKMQSTIGTTLTYADPKHPSPETIVSGGPNGVWWVCGPIVHELTAWIPDGPWITSAVAVRFPGYPQLENG